MTTLYLLAAATAVTALAIALFWVAAPLWRGAPAAVGDDPRIVGLLVEREAILATLRDLDDDARDGRLATGEHAAMRAETLARGVAVLSALDRLAAERPSGGAEGDTAAIEADIRRARARLDGGA